MGMSLKIIQSIFRRTAGSESGLAVVSISRRAFASSEHGSHPAIPTRFQNKIFINNEFRESSDGKTFQTVNPVNDKIITNIH